MTEKIKKITSFLQCFNFSIQQHVRKLGNLGRAPSCPLSPSLLPGSQPYAPNDSAVVEKKCRVAGPSRAPSHVYAIGYAKNKSLNRLVCPSLGSSMLIPPNAIAQIAIKNHVVS